MVGRAGFIKLVGWAGFLKKNQLRQNGDLASLDFVVNDIEQRILLFRGFVETLNPVVVIFCKTWHLFFSSNRSICCIFSFKGNKAN
jgi:hypothetical protein